MRWYRILFVVAVSFLVSCDATKEPNEIKAPTVALAATLNSSSPIDKRRYLREDRPANADGHVNNEDGDSGMRAGPGAIVPYQALSRVESLTGGFSRASNWLREVVARAMPIKWRLRLWAKNGKSLDFVKKELGLERYSEDALVRAPNFKYYDDYVNSLLPVWARKQLTPTEVKVELGLQNLPDEFLVHFLNFKYYDEYLKAQALVWGKQDLSVDDVLIRLGLNTLPWRLRPKTVNYKYYDDFVSNQLMTWMKNDVPVLDVMAKLHLDKLSGEAIISHPNYRFYKLYVKSNLKLWAADWVPEETVKARLGLKTLAGRTLTNHPNFPFFQKYETKRYKYQLEGWLKQGRTTYDVWLKLKLDEYRLVMIRPSAAFKVYKDYVNIMDKYILKLMKRGFEVPDLISKSASETELRLKTQIWTSAKRPEEYIKYSLGLKGLEGDALKAAPNYQFYELYLQGRPHIK